MCPTADDHGTVPKSNQQRAKMTFIVHPLAHCLRDTRAYCLPRCSLPPVVTAAKPRLPQSIDRPRAASPQLLPAFRRCRCLRRLAGGRPQPSASSISAPHRAQVPLPSSMPRPSPAPFFIPRRIRTGCKGSMFFSPALVWVGAGCHLLPALYWVGVRALGLGQQADAALGRRGRPTASATGCNWIWLPHWGFSRVFIYHNSR